MGGTAVAIDSYAHGSFILTPVEFLKLNVLEGIGSFYGTHPWYNISQNNVKFVNVYNLYF